MALQLPQLVLHIGLLRGCGICAQRLQLGFELFQRFVAALEIGRAFAEGPLHSVALVFKIMALILDLVALFLDLMALFLEDVTLNLDFMTFLFKRLTLVFEHPPLIRAGARQWWRRRRRRCLAVV